MATVQIERTSKVLKGFIALGVLGMAGAALLAWRTWGSADLRYAAWLFAAGLLVYVGARVACWWQYG